MLIAEDGRGSGVGLFPGITIHNSLCPQEFLTINILFVLTSNQKCESAPVGPLNIDLGVHGALEHVSCMHDMVLMVPQRGILKRISNKCDVTMIKVQ